MKKGAVDKKLLPKCPPTSPCLGDEEMMKMAIQGMLGGMLGECRARSIKRPFWCLGFTGIWDGLEIRDVHSFFQLEC